ncbi:tRNA pseudouridine(55) synthase TruB [Thermodesulfobacteriota bacterium]
MPNNRECPLDGILLIDKEEGKTSFEVVKGVKRILGIKKVGHAGTLDPFATGLLIILIGRGTKLSSYLMAGKKRYLASIRLGIETDTLDPTGKIINEMPVPVLDEEAIEKTLNGFKGVVEQVPPAFSAINIKGQRAYKLARRGFDVKLEKRKVSIYYIGLINVRLPVITVDVICSPGTYIRSLASDIGRRLGSVAHLKKLRRVSSGSFEVDDSFAWKDFKQSSGDDLKKGIISMNAALPDMLEIVVDDGMAARIKNGHKPSWEDLFKDNESPGIFLENIKLANNSSLVAILEIDQPMDRGEKWIKKLRVFN